MTGMGLYPRKALSPALGNSGASGTSGAVAGVGVAESGAVFVISSPLRERL
jgi:hypothetical protein